MLEPSDSQEAYDFTLRAIEISERWRVPVLLRMTTRVCHSKTVVRRDGKLLPQPRAPREFVRDVRSRVMIPAYARPAHHRLREKLRADGGLERSRRSQPGSRRLGVAGHHHLRNFLSACARSRARSQRAEAGHDLSAAAGADAQIRRRRRALPGRSKRATRTWWRPRARPAFAVEGKPEMFRFGELNVDPRAPHRGRRHLAGAEAGSRQAAGVVPRMPASQRVRQR